MIVSSSARARGWTPPAKPRPAVSTGAAPKGAPKVTKSGAKVKRAAVDLLLRQPHDLPDSQLAWGMPVGPKDRTRANLSGLRSRVAVDDRQMVDGTGQDVARKASKLDVNVAAATLHAETIAEGKHWNMPAFLAHK